LGLGLKFNLFYGIPCLLYNSPIGNSHFFEEKDKKIKKEKKFLNEG